MLDRHLTDMSLRTLDEHLSYGDLTRLRRFDGVTIALPQSFHPSWQRLISRGFVETDGKTIEITDKGRRKC